MIREDLKRTNPKIHKEVTYWRPHDYATILLYLKDGGKATYSYDTKQVSYLEGE